MTHFTVLYNLLSLTNNAQPKPNTFEYHQPVDVSSNEVEVVELRDVYIHTTVALF